MSVIFEFSRLRGLIKEHCGTNENFARSIGISPTSLYDRLANRVAFDTVEISKAMEIFGIPDANIDEIFFVRKYGKPE